MHQNLTLLRRIKLISLNSHLSHLCSSKHQYWLGTGPASGWVITTDLSPCPVSGSKTTSYPIPCPAVSALKFTKFKHVTLLRGQCHQPGHWPHSPQHEERGGKVMRMMIEAKIIHPHSFLWLSVTVIQCYTSAALLPLPIKQNKQMTDPSSHHRMHHTAEGSWHCDTCVTPSETESLFHPTDVTSEDACVLSSVGVTWPLQPLNADVTGV